MSDDPGPRSRLRARAALIMAAGVLALVGIGSAVAVILSSGSPTGRGRATSTASIATTTQPAAEQFGVNVNRLFNDRTFSDAQIDAQLTALAATGASIARSDALWELAEPQPPVGGVHHYDWSFDDHIAGSLASHRLRWLPIIDYAAVWAQSNESVLHSPPRSAAEYAQFATAFAGRYGRGGSFWSGHPALPAEPVETYEIWNEPDNPVFWKPGPDPGGYADLYLQARAAIKTVDPTAYVIVGGLTAPATFLPAMAAARPGLAETVDGVAVHPYGPGPSAVLHGVQRARAALKSVGMGSVPLYVTEVGWTTSPAGALSWAPARLRGRYLISTLTALGHSDCGVAAVVVYTWVTPERDPRNREDWFGIHAPVNGASPDTRAFTEGLHGGQRSAPTIQLCAGG